jgi:hypothetical protein
MGGQHPTAGGDLRDRHSNGSLHSVTRGAGMRLHGAEPSLVDAPLGMTRCNRAYQTGPHPHSFARRGLTSPREGVRLIHMIDGAHAPSADTPHTERLQ